MLRRKMLMGTGLVLQIEPQSVSGFESRSGETFIEAVLSVGNELCITPVMERVIFCVSSNLSPFANIFCRQQHHVQG